MIKEYNKTDPLELSENVFKLIGEDWMLLAAGKRSSYNMMTASWGGFGVLWGKKVCFCFVRPHRHTFRFIEESSHFSLNFFEEKYRDILNLCGSKSGKSINKMEVSGLKASETGSGNIFFDEARLVIECKKIYFQDIKSENFLDSSIETNYPKKDYHRMYIGEITGCFKK